MFDWVIGGLGELFGFVGDAVGATIGWAWDKVITGIYQWLANGLALLIEWVWSVLDSATTPRLTEAWFRNDLAARVGLIGLAVTVAMMFASAAQAALAGRPEQIGDVLKESIRAIVASAFTITVIDVMIGVTDEASAMVWQVGRPDLVRLIENMVGVATVVGPLSTTFVGPLVLLFGFIGLIGLVVSLMMRSALIYVVAALAPIVWSLGVLPSFRGSSRKLVHLAVALVVSKLAIVITLVVAVKLISNPGGDPDAGAINDAVAAVGTLMSGFICFLVAALTPIVLYRLMPTVEGAMVGSGVASGWTRGVTTAAHTVLMVKSLGASAGASAATKAVGGQSGVGSAAAAAAGSAGPAPSGGGSASAGNAPANGPTTSIGRPAGGSTGPPGGASGGGSQAQQSSSPSRPISRPVAAPPSDEDERKPAESQEVDRG